MAKADTKHVKIIAAIYKISEMYPKGFSFREIIIAHDWRRGSFGIFEFRHGLKVRQIFAHGPCHSEIYESEKPKEEWIADLIELADSIRDQNQGKDNTHSTERGEADD